MRWLVLGLLVGCGGKDVPAAADAAPAATGDATVIDLTDNKELEQIALKALNAYRSKDLQTLAELGPPGAKDKLIFLEPRNPHYAELLGDDTWRMKSLKAWDGQKLIKLERGIDTALAWYWEDDKDRYAMELHKDNGHWQFFDLVQRPK